MIPPDTSVKFIPAGLYGTVDVNDIFGMAAVMDCVLVNVLAADTAAPDADHGIPLTATPAQLMVPFTSRKYVLLGSFPIPTLEMVLIELVVILLETIVSPFILTLPTTSNGYIGVLVPIPTVVKMDFVTVKLVTTWLDIVALVDISVGTVNVVIVPVVTFALDTIAFDIVAFEITAYDKFVLPEMVALPITSILFLPRDMVAVPFCENKSESYVNVAPVVLCAIFKAPTPTVLPSIKYIPDGSNAAV